MGAIFEPFVWILGLIVDFYLTVVIVEVVLHWLVHFKIVEVKNKYAQTTIELLAKATKPVYDKIREKLPTVSGFDLSPVVLIFVLLFLSRLLYRLDIALLS